MNQDQQERKPTPLKVARQERDSAREEASLLRQALQCAVAEPPAFTSQRTDKDGYLLSASLYRPTHPSGGLVVLSEVSPTTGRTSVSALSLDSWNDSIREKASHGTLDYAVSELVGELTSARYAALQEA